MESHKSRRTGDRLRRLEEGHAYLEKLFVQKIWWPAFGNLDHLHPEYEVKDFKDGNRYIDLAFIPSYTRIGLEADGFDTHVKKIDRWAFADNLMRDAHLIADGWTMLHFSSDLIEHRPRQVQQVLQQIMWGRERKKGKVVLTLEEKELLRLFRMKGAPVAPSEAKAYLSVCFNTMKKLLASLAGKKLIVPYGNTKLRIRAYELTREGYEAISERE